MRAALFAVGCMPLLDGACLRKAQPTSRFTQAAPLFDAATELYILRLNRRLSRGCALAAWNEPELQRHIFTVAATHDFDLIAADAIVTEYEAATFENMIFHARHPSLGFSLFPVLPAINDNVPIIIGAATQLHEEVIKPNNSIFPLENLRLKMLLLSGLRKRRVNGGCRQQAAA
jgi:hypothetical protein